MLAHEVHSQPQYHIHNVRDNLNLAGLISNLAMATNFKQIATSRFTLAAILYSTTFLPSVERRPVISMHGSFGARHRSPFFRNTRFTPQLPKDVVLQPCEWHQYMCQ